ncbi:hypothetical protein [Thioclava dalianensis]|nr:hypothetical protein [Thioclava dalianensis]
MNWGISKGIGMASNRGRKDKAPQEMTAQERQQQQEMKLAAKRARKSARLTRRM